MGETSQPVEMDLETNTEDVNVDVFPYQGGFFPDSSKCKSEQKSLMKKECEISGSYQHCQTEEIEVEIIVEEEICHGITTLVCQEPLIRSKEEAETTTTAADTESMDTTTVTNPKADVKSVYVPTLDKSEEESTNEMANGRSIEYEPHGCVKKVSEVCYPSQRVETASTPKQFCWGKKVVSCHEEVEQTVDTVVCNDDGSHPLAKVRVTTIEPDTTTIDQDQLGRILVLATTTKAVDVATTIITPVAVEEVARIAVATTTTADDLVTTTAEAVDARILVATTTTTEDLITTAADEVARIFVATTTTAEDIATTKVDEQGRILVAATTAEPMESEDKSMEEEIIGNADAKVADGTARVTTVAPQETTNIAKAKVAEGDSSSDEDEETAATTTESDHDDHGDNDHDNDQAEPEPETTTHHKSL